MNGGKQPVQDGDYLLLELIDSAKAGSITGSTVVIERQEAGGDDQYLLRLVTKTPGWPLHPQGHQPGLSRLRGR